VFRQRTRSLQWHIRHQAAFSAIRTTAFQTINLPNSAGEEDVASAYRLAWELGCLGITVFRDGCKGEQVLNIGVAPKKEQEATATLAAGPAVIKPRPHSLTGSTYRMETPIGTAFITVNETPEGDPFEVFVQVGKGGPHHGRGRSARPPDLADLETAISVVHKRRLEGISQLARIGGGSPMGFGPGRPIAPDALARTPPNTSDRSRLRPLSSRNQWPQARWRPVQECGVSCTRKGARCLSRLQRVLRRGKGCRSPGC
jgi:ribonucleoside-diphosphate reductase alpha chain